MNWLIGVLERRKKRGTMAKLWKENMTLREVKLELNKRVEIPTVLYVSKTWSLRVKKEAFEMMSLRSI